jgi:hypothetical protein
VPAHIPISILYVRDVCGDAPRFCRAVRVARLVDGADEVHKMVLAKFMREEGRDFWMWSAGNRV